MSNISKIQVGDTTYNIKDAEAERIVIKNSSGAIASFDDGIEAPAANVKVKIEPVQEGEGDPSPDNVRPINGWTGMNITRCGANLFDISKATKSMSPSTFSVINNEMHIIANTTQDYTGGYISRDIFTYKAGKTYYVKFKIKPSSTFNNYSRFVFRTASGAGISIVRSIILKTGQYEYSYQFTLDVDCYAAFILNGASDENKGADVTFYDIMISEVDIPYEPYQGNTYSITFPSEAGTVYGGELDVTSGKLTVTHVLYTFDGSEDEQWTLGNHSNRYEFNFKFLINNFKTYNSGGRGLSNIGIYDNSTYIDNFDYITSRSAVGYSESGSTMHVLITPPSIATTVSELRTFLSNNPEQWYAPLQTPLIYQLTPTEVTTLLGQNNIWADTGNTSIIYWQNKALADSIHSNFSIIKDTIGTKKYGVKGIGQAQSELTRTYDSVNMVAAVGSPTKYVQNDFDYAAPFMRRKCVGYWEKNPQHDKRAIFHVMAYEGDANYTEDGTMGDYVAVECPRCYYKRDGDELIISAYKHQGFRAFDIFCHEHNQNDTMEFYYMPAYPLAMKDGHAVSLPGLRNEQGDWATLYNSAKTYNNEEVAVLAQLMPAAVNFYEWALMTVEFATQNMQNIMYGVAGCYWADNKTGQFTSLEGTITFECAENPTTIIAGDYVRIGTYSGGSDYRTLPSHKVLTATSNNGKRILTLEPTGWSTISYTTETNYYISGSHVPTGLTKDILTSSGVEDHTATNTHNAIRYRYHENPYGNQYHTSADLFNVATIIPDATTTSVNVKYGASLDWYYLPDATSITTAVNPANNTTSLSTDERFVKLGISTPSEKYASGYIKSVQYDIAYPDIWTPETTEGGSATTYFSDQASLVSSNFCRSCRFGGHWSYGTIAGPLSLLAYYAPSSALASSGGDLYFPQ